MSRITFWFGLLRHWHLFNSSPMLMKKSTQTEIPTFVSGSTLKFLVKMFCVLFKWAIHWTVLNINCKGDIDRKRDILQFENLVSYLLFQSNWTVHTMRGGTVIAIVDSRWRLFLPIWLFQQMNVWFSNAAWPVLFKQIFSSQKAWLWALR